MCRLLAAFHLADCRLPELAPRPQVALRWLPGFSGPSPSTSLDESAFRTYSVVNVLYCVYPVLQRIPRSRFWRTNCPFLVLSRCYSANRCSRLLEKPNFS